MYEYSVLWKVDGKSLYMCRDAVVAEGVRVVFRSMEFLGGRWREPKDLFRVSEDTARGCVEELSEQNRGQEYKAVKI